MRTRIQTPKKILIIGSTCVDIIINVDHLPKTEEDITMRLTLSASLERPIPLFHR